MNRRAQITIPAYFIRHISIYNANTIFFDKFYAYVGPPPTPLWVEGTKMAASFNKRFDFYTIFSFLLLLLIQYLSGVPV